MAAPSAAERAAILLSVTVLVALATLASCNTEGDILYAQRLAWEDPYNTMQSWNPKLINPCTWLHITCNNDNSVIRVDLGNSGISGPLIAQLGGLKNLQYLELYENRLNGSIPPTLGKLSHLVSLDLQDNNIVGTIPTSLGAISTLRFLRLSANMLTGSIPPSMGNLMSLEFLELQNNELSGSIPASLGKIKTLGYLRLNANLLTGRVPFEILSLVLVGNLAELNVQNNNLDGTVRKPGIRVTRIIQDILKTSS
ncbi:disease resistance protein BAK6-like [Phragmites australis]|uniref:disease resistance protein BAK6-like n=1 Tax=Phragmites australis TaxID=29695 RepID=UPI002D76D631|nr:disease resistance protein BAK6-like [Phragmites australis]